MRLAELPPLSLYVHIPWCLRKCPYCDFNSHEKRGELPEAEYVDALICDLEASLPDVWGRRLHTIFIGGGTPSLFSPQSIDRLLTAVRTRLMVDPDTEVTMEANPGTFEVERFRGYRAAGVNRLSFGVQSFHDERLAAIGRVHGADEARRAVASALEIFPTVNTDLMYALPGQSLDEALLDVREAIEQTLAASGYGHYETSAFAKPGERARHNVNYWTFGDYLGIGAGAHGKISFRDRIVREQRERKPQAYLRTAMQGDAIQESREVAAAELPFEFMLNALRLIEGFPVALFAQRTGLPIHILDRELSGAENAGLIARDHATIRPTEKGRRFLNDLLEPFLPVKETRGTTIPINISSPGTSRPS
jgi:coproporphyrinogen III oxidase-like Fe-S oxidoreductase